MANQEDILINIKAETDKATKEISKLSKELDKLKKASEKSSKSTKAQADSFKSIGNAAAGLKTKLLGLVAAYASLEGAKSLIKTSADIEEGFLNISKTTGIAGEEMDNFKEKIYDMSTSLAGVELSGLQEIAETAGQLGISGTEDILKFTEVIVKMATTTDLSAQEAAASMAQLGNSLGIPVEQYENLGSAINELSNTTTASAGDLINYGQRIAGMGKTFGLSADEILAFSATLKDVGISAELGGTAVSKMMMEMLKNTEGFAKVAGVSLQEYSVLIEEEPVRAIEVFLEALGKMDKAAKITALDELGLKSSGATQTMLKLADGTDKLSVALATSGEAFVKNTSLQNEYNVASEGFNAQLIKAENAIKILASRIGEELLPKLKETVDAFVEWMDSLSEEEIKKYSEQIAGMAETFGSLMAVVGQYTVAVAGFVADNGKMIISIYALIKAVNLAKGAMVLFGAQSVAMAGSSASFVTSTASMTRGLTGLWKGLTAVVGMAGPWGVAIAGIIATTSAAGSAIDNYTEGLKKTAEADLKSADTMDAHTGKIEGIGEAYQKADAEVEKHGSVTEETRDKISKALESEIASIEKQMEAWNRSGEMTKVQEQNFLALSATLGVLQAKLDTLPAVYSLDINADATDANKTIDQLEKPISTTLGIKSNSKDVQGAIDKLKVPTSSTHTVNIRYNDPGRPYATGGLVQKLADGGTFTGSGSVPGYDPSDSDKVNAVLTGGEYVIKRAAVDILGADMLQKMNTNPKAFAEGGMNAAAIGLNAPIQPINLTIGNDTYPMMTDAEVAQALQRNLENEGGM